MEITKDSFESNLKNEWLLTNGIGGYASSTICDCNTRKYHGLLVAALGENGERFLCLSKISESLIFRSEEYSLSTNECNNFIEKGYLHQTSFSKVYLPHYEYEAKGVKVTKDIAMKYGENKIAICYHVKTQKEEVTLELKPFVNFRDFHSVRNCFELAQEVEETSVNVHLNSHGVTLHMAIAEGEYLPYSRTYYKNMYYRQEDDRGLEAYETHNMPGAFRIAFPKNFEGDVEFIAYVDEKNDFIQKVKAKDLIRGEQVRLEKLCKMAGCTTEWQRTVAMAADSFVIQKNGRKTIIAGYPWFGDWGRDTFIALKGLTLKLNRYRDAKEIILGFKDYIKDGLVPNLISEKGGSAYNSVDASLWYINAIYQYYKYTNDFDFVQSMFPTMLAIIEAYKNGTMYGIQMDPEDGLIRAGNETTQLTWMDAKVGDVIPTPRYGKAVEINGLWYNALKIVEMFSNFLGEKYDASLSQKVEHSFQKFFAKEGLYDTIDPICEKVRPNQLIVLSLDFSPITKEHAREIMAYLYPILYTKKGLRTLSPKDEDYHPYYFGGVYERDTAYHQGTVWPFLLMFYNAAYKKYYKKNNDEIDYYGLLHDGCVGNVCEIYDAEKQDKAKGAFAQAWSVAMLIENLF